MKILYITGREILYPRNDVILRAFQRFSDVTVIGYRTRGPLALRSIILSLQALPHLFFGRYDILFVGFYGHLIMLVVGLFSRTPILFDAFVSTYDTLVSDRGVFSPRSIQAKIAWWLDRTACRLADWILVDTPLQATFFQEHFTESSKMISAVPVGCNEDLFFFQKPKPHANFEILYYCSFLPLHGVDIVVQAASYLKDTPIHFKLIGSGPEYARVRKIAADLSIQQITWIDQIPLERIPSEIASADICLGGHFGSSEKAGRVVPGKLFQMLAVGCPVIAADTEANRALLEHNKNSFLCPPGDPRALADAILELYHDPIRREALGDEGHTLFEKHCSEAVIGKNLQEICDYLLGEK
jgi:glycosyltransferase involved in cell wall biosynthesis